MPKRTEIFIVIAINGFQHFIPNLNRTIFFPFSKEFKARRVDDSTIMYNSHLIPIRGEQDEIVMIEKKCIDDWIWKVSSSNQMIDIFSDSSLENYSYSVFPNTEIHIQQSFFKDGIEIFQVYDRDLFFHSTSLVPMKHLLIGRVLNTDGVILRKGKEIYSEVIGILPFNTKIVIEQKAFSDIPTNCRIPRYQLFDKKGWINVLSHSKSPNIEIIGLCNDPFSVSTVVIDMNHNSPFISTESQEQSEKCIICMNKEKIYSVIHNDYGHLLYCEDCVDKMKTRNENCPICRTPVIQYLRMYQ
jgi:hypothetical protein